MWFGARKLLYRSLICGFRHSNFCPPFAVNLNGQRDAVFNQRAGVGFSAVGGRANARRPPPGAPGFLQQP
ncbi:MAG: hypothetical protein CML80_02575, partial [Rhodobiaceae bacterium]|nr:hypothetical protein [Rhodobiaceae bacterium]